METTAIPSAAIGAAARGTSNSRATDLSSQDFFKLLITELQSQDPLKPKDTGQIVQQVANIRQLDLSNRLDSTLTGLAEQDRLVGVTNMIGKVVTGLVRSGGDGTQLQEVSGLVVGVTFDDKGEAVLELEGGDTLPASAVRSVSATPPPESAIANVFKGIFNTTPATARAGDN